MTGNATAQDPPTNEGKALLLTCFKPKSLLIYIASAAVAAQNFSTLVLVNVDRFVFRGGVEKATEMFSFYHEHPNGGFAGKYISRQNVYEEDAYVCIFPLGDLNPLEEIYSPRHLVWNSLSDAALLHMTTAATRYTSFS